MKGLERPIERYPVRSSLREVAVARRQPIEHAVAGLNEAGIGATTVLDAERMHHLERCIGPEPKDDAPPPSPRLAAAEVGTDMEVMTRVSLRGLACRDQRLVRAGVSARRAGRNHSGS